MAFEGVVYQGPRRRQGVLSATVNYGPRHQSHGKFNTRK